MKWFVLLPASLFAFYFALVSRSVCCCCSAILGLLVMYFLDSWRQTLFAQSVHQIHEWEDITIVYTILILIYRDLKSIILLLVFFYCFYMFMLGWVVHKLWICAWRLKKGFRLNWLVMHFTNVACKILKGAEKGNFFLVCFIIWANYKHNIDENIGNH